MGGFCSAGHAGARGWFCGVVRFGACVRGVAAFDLDGGIWGFVGSAGGVAAGAEGCDCGVAGGGEKPLADGRGSESRGADRGVADRRAADGSSSGRRGSNGRVSDWFIAYFGRIVDCGGAISGGGGPHGPHGASGAARGVCPGAGRSVVPRPRDQPPGARPGKPRCGSAHDLGYAASGCDAARSGVRMAGCSVARRRAA